MSTQHFFSAEILIIGVNPYVLLPENVLDAIFNQSGKRSGAIQVKGTLNGKPYRQTLVKYAGMWRLYLNTPMRKSAGIDVGDMAELAIEFDNEPRVIIMHPKLAEVLSENQEANDIFQQLSPSRKKEIIRYIANLKTTESVERNITKLIQHLLGKERFAGKE